MIIFILTYLSIYGGAHLYLLLKVKNSLLPGCGCLPVLSTFITLMVLAPILTRVCERAGLETFARIMAHSGYIWMGLFFTVFSASIVLDLYRLLLYLVDRSFPQLRVGKTEQRRLNSFVIVLRSRPAHCRNRDPALAFEPITILPRPPLNNVGTSIYLQLLSRCGKILRHRFQATCRDT